MPARQTYESYTVKKGDTLNAIAARYGTTAATIAVTSGIADPNKIKVGQVLSIPVTPIGGAAADDDLAPVTVTATRLTQPRAPSGDPVVDAVMTVGEWLKPPKLYATLGAAFALGLYLINDDRKRRR